MAKKKKDLEIFKNPKGRSFVPKTNELKAVLETVYPSVIRLSNAHLEVNKTWYHVKEAEIRIAKTGVRVIKADVDGCITSW
jgi:hypothetical protein